MCIFICDHTMGTRSKYNSIYIIHIYTCVFSSHSLFWKSSSLDVPAGVTQEEGHTGFVNHLLSAVRAVFFSREGFSHSFPTSTVKSNLRFNRSPPVGHFLFLFFLVRKIPFAGIELTSQRVRGLRGTSELPGRPALNSAYQIYDSLLVQVSSDASYHE